jgi:hypothetical protein
MKKVINKKVYKGCLYNLIMRKSGDLCFSGIFLNSLSLKKCSNNNLCSNFGVMTTS